MAEFKKIMKEAIRMCQTVGSCTDCPIISYVTCECPFAESDSMFDYEFEAIENEIEKWAKKHKTPTWLEYLTSIGVTPSFSIQDQGSPAQTILTFNAINTTDIPYDIAVKLGIVKEE